MECLLFCWFAWMHYFLLLRVSPSPSYPMKHLQLNPPCLFSQFAYFEQLCIPSKHSSISTCTCAHNYAQLGIELLNIVSHNICYTSKPRHPFSLSSLVPLGHSQSYEPWELTQNDDVGQVCLDDLHSSISKHT